MATMVVANAALPSAGDRLGAALSADRLVLCTPAGLVQYDLDGKPLTPLDGAGHAELCVFCLPLMQAALDAPPVLVVAQAPALPVIVRTMPVERHLPFTRPVDLGAVSPRGPPRA